MVSTVLLLRTFLPLIRRGKDKKIMALSSVLGSIEVGFGMRGLANTYAVLKASLNMSAILNLFVPLDTNEDEQAGAKVGIRFERRRNYDIRYTSR